MTGNESRPDPELFAKLPKWIRILYELAEEAGVAEHVFTCDHEREKRGRAITVEARSWR
ncbi:MAG: hypothetical protein QW542_05665 [Thermoproteota archaeon]